MRQRIVIVLLMLGIAHYVDGQTRDSSSKRTATGRLLQKMQIAFPELVAVGVHKPIKSSQLSALPHAAGEIFNDNKVSFSGRIVFGSYNATSRILSLTWKKKFGIDLYRAQYSFRVDLADYNHKLQSLYPDHYIDGIQPYNGRPSGYSSSAEITCFSGWLYGAHYTIPIKKYLLQPKILVGFNSGTGWGTRSAGADYMYKTKGSNYPMLSSVDYATFIEHKGIYVAEVVFCRHFAEPEFLKKHLVWDIGVKAALAVKPYIYAITITDQQWQQPATTQTLKGNDTRLIPSVNVYLSICTK